MDCYVVVEGKSDVELLKRVLGDEVSSRSAQITDGGGRSGAASLATSILAVRRRPVVLVLDADTTEESLVAEQRAYHEYRFRMAGGAREARVVMAVPTLEICLFQAPSVLSNALAIQLGEEQRIKAEYVPSKVLAELVPQGSHGHPLTSVASRLKPDHVRELRGTPLIQEILHAIADVTKQQAA
jgi:hypothetical protein